MNGRVRGMLFLLAGLLCVGALSACVKYFPRDEEQSSAQNGTESTVTDAPAATAEEETIPNLPSADATKRY